MPAPNITVPVNKLFVYSWSLFFIQENGQESRFLDGSGVDLDSNEFVVMKLVGKEKRKKLSYQHLNNSEMKNESFSSSYLASPLTLYLIVLLYG